MGQYEKIRKEIAERIRVAVDADGYYDTAATPEAVFDVRAETDSLSNYKTTKEDLQYQYDRCARAAHFQPVFGQITEIEMLLDQYAEGLRINAVKNRVDIIKVKDEIWEKHARRFEDVHKSKLRLISPSAWNA